jgi:hypothetical protein
MLGSVPPRFKSKPILVGIVLPFWGDAMTFDAPVAEMSLD